MRDDRHFHAQVRADHENALPSVDIGDAAAEKRRRRIVRLIAEVTLAQAVIDVVATEVPRDALEQVRLFERRARADERSEATRAADFGSLLERADRGGERVLPRGLDPGAIALHARPQEPVRTVDAMAAEAVAVRDPALVDLLVLARHDTPQAAAQHVRVKIAAGTVMWAHDGLRGHFPRARAVAVRLVVQRPDGAQIDDVARELVVDALLDVGADLRAVAPEVSA